jgi:hypothetical protein
MQYSKTYASIRLGRVVDDHWLVFFRIRGTEGIDEEFLTLGLEYIAAWGKGRTIIGSLAFETYVFWFVENCLINERLAPEYAVEVEVKAVIEKEYVTQEVVETVCNTVDPVLQSPEDKVDRIGDWAVHLDKFCGVNGLESVFERANLLGFDHSREKLDMMSISFEDNFSPYYNIRMYDDGVGWKYKFDIGGGSVKTSYLESLGLVKEKDGNNALQTFLKILSDESFRSDQPIYFNYEWIAEEFFDVYNEPARLEEFIIKYARILIMRPCYIGIGPLNYILVRDWGDLDINVYEFMSIPLIVNNLLGSFVFKNGGGTVFELEQFIVAADSIYEGTKKPSKILQSVFGLLECIGVSQVYLHEFVTAEWRAELVGTSNVLDYCNLRMYRDRESSFDLYYTELMVCCALDSSPKDYLDKVDYFSPKRRKIRNKKKEDKRLGYMVYDEEGMAFITKAAKYKDIVVKAVDCAVQSTLVDESPEFKDFVVKRIILGGCYSKFGSTRWLAEARYPLGDPIDMSTFEKFMDTCAEYVEDLIRRGVYDRDIFVSSELMSYLRMARLTSVWGRACFSYSGMTLEDLG